ncbi:MAG TPA: hypothetical protein VMM92_07900 [Thermoanaerobaculia bacterium]|nr:hypothetical protein [Thermoanaerobaculia bacterium]
MCTAKLCVWITAFGHPCEIVNTADQWYVHVVDCEGNVVQWCGKEYRNLHARCGHLEIEIPPGCYSVFASHTPNTSGSSFGNRLTHVQVVRVNCGDEACVTLFSPTLWFCGNWFTNAVSIYRPKLIQHGVEEQTLTAAIESVSRLLAKIPADPFSANLQKLEREFARE